MVSYWKSPENVLFGDPSFPIEKMTVIFLTSWSPWSPANVRTSTLSPSELPCTWCLSHATEENLQEFQKFRENPEKISTKISRQNQPVGVFLFKKKNAQTNRHFEPSKPSQYCWRAPPLQHSQPRINKWTRGIFPPRGRLHVVPSSRHHTSICVGSPSSSEMICLVNLMNLRKKKSQFVDKLFQWMQNALQAIEISIKMISQDALVRNPKRWML